MLETAVEAKFLKSMQQSVIGSIDGQMQSMREDLQQNVIGGVTESVQRNILGEVSESMEIEKRKFNLILHGIKESENGDDGDVDLVNEILRSISIDPVRHVDGVSRVRHAATDKVRPTRIKVKTLEGRSEILKRAKNLKHGSFKRVYISPDLTRRQQEVDKDLRQKLKSFREGSEPNAKIRGGKIVKKKLGGRRGGNSVRTTKVDAAEVVCKQGNENMIGIKCKKINKTNEIKKM